MEVSELTTGEILKTAWEKFEQNWLGLIAVFLLQMIISFLLSQIVNATSGGFEKILQLSRFIVLILLGLGLMNIMLKVGKNEEFQLADLFIGFNDPILFLLYLGCGLLYFLIFFGGLLLLIVPGIIWGISFSLALYFIIDQGLGPIEALKASSKTTKGHKGSLFGIYLVFLLIAGAFTALIILIATSMGVSLANLENSIIYQFLSIGIMPATIVINIGYALIYLYLSQKISDPDSPQST